MMPDDQRKANYRRKRRVRGEEALEEEGSGGEEETQIVFDQDDFGGKLREFFWQQGPGMVHFGLAKIGKEMVKFPPCPGMNFLGPQLYFDDIVAKQRLREIDLEVELEMARSVGVVEFGQADNNVIGDDGNAESDGD